MPLTVVNHEMTEEARLSDYRFDVVNFRGPASYTTGGVTPVASALNFTRIAAMVPIIHGGYMWDLLDTDKLRFMQQSAATGALTEVPNAANLSGQIFRALVIGQ